jgi:membrane-anchored protein YejM (alkaline phosphatase superfamily)
VWSYPFPAAYKTAADERAGMAGSLRNELRVVGASLPFSLVGNRAAALRQNQAECLASLQNEAIEEAANRSRALVFLHLPLPHPPGIYDAAAERVDTSRNHSYLESLDQTDRLLGSIRESMEASGAWSDTVLIVSSDHTLRSAHWKTHPGWYAPDSALQVDDRVPFLVHFPGEAHGVEFSGALHTIVSRELIEHVLTGEVENQRDASAWLAARSKEKDMNVR